MAVRSRGRRTWIGLSAPAERWCSSARARRSSPDIDLLLSEARGGDAAVRVVLTRGGHRLCRLESLGDPEDLISPARLLPVMYNPSGLLDGVKTLSYGANMLASRRARAEGYDEALLVRSDGVVLEGPTCSIFWVRDGRLRTPALQTGILASITRRVLLESLPVEEGSFALQDAAGAERGVPGLDRAVGPAHRRHRRGDPARGSGTADAAGARRRSSRPWPKARSPDSRDARARPRHRDRRGHAGPAQRDHRRRRRARRPRDADPRRRARSWSGAGPVRTGVTVVLPRPDRRLGRARVRRLRTG